MCWHREIHMFVSMYLLAYMYLISTYMWVYHHIRAHMCHKSFLGVTIFIYIHLYLCVHTYTYELSIHMHAEINTHKYSWMQLQICITSDVEYLFASHYTHIPSQFGDLCHLMFMKHFGDFFRLFWHPFLLISIP